MILISILIAVAIIIGLLGLSVYMLRPETEKTRSFACLRQYNDRAPGLV